MGGLCVPPEQSERAKPCEKKSPHHYGQGQRRPERAGLSQENDGDDEEFDDDGRDPGKNGK